MLAVVFVGVIGLGFAGGARLVVSPAGSDATGNGSLERPFATLTGCINAHKSTSPSPRSSGCLLRGGTYTETQATVSGVAGTATAPFIIAAYDRDNEPAVVFDGTIPLDGLSWKQLQDARAGMNGSSTGVWSAIVPESLAGEGVYQLFADRVMWTPARWQVSDFLLLP